MKPVPELFIDFETRAAVNIVRGLPNYFGDPWWDALCAAWFIVRKGEEPGAPNLWVAGERCPSDIYDHCRKGLPVWGHNVEFERRCFNTLHSRGVGWPPVTIEQSYCTMSMAYAANLPGSLEASAEAVDIKARKDKRGAEILRDVCVPEAMTECLFCFSAGCGVCRNTGETPTWKHVSEEDWHHFIHVYCPQDIVVCQELSRKIPRLTSRLRSLWILDQRINERGIALDLAAIYKAQEVCKREEGYLVEQITEMTKGFVDSVGANGKWVDWLKKEAPQLKATSIAADKVIEYLENDTIDPAVRRALELRQEIAKSSTKKIAGPVGLLSKQHGGRLHGGYQFHGAGTTGRFAGRGPQPQNLPRPTIPQDLIEHILNDLGCGHWDREFVRLFTHPLHAVSSCLRGMFMASTGKDLVSVDYSAIEARGLAWLAGQESMLEVFRTHGKLYEHIAVQVLGARSIEEVTPDQRFRGKVIALFTGYGGGVGAGKTMGANYGLHLPDSEWERFRDGFREANPYIVSWWYDLEEAAVSAVENPGIGFPVRRRYGTVTFKVVGSFLCCKMPSGKVNLYPYPVLMDRTTPWGALKNCITYRTLATKQDNELLVPSEPQIRTKRGRWARVHTYGGKLAENITQSEMGTFMFEGMLRVDAAGYNIVMHTHDEITCEVDRADRSNHVEKIGKIMCHLPEWATGLPVTTEGWKGMRYRK